MLLRTVIMMSLFGLAPAAWAHGENKPGPQGGYIRMPGAYHVELIPYQNQGFKVRLLDLQFRPAPLKGAKLRLVWQQGKQQQVLRCGVHPDHFYCEGPEGKRPNRGRLILSSEHLGRKGLDVTYLLPLTYGEAASHRQH